LIILTGVNISVSAQNERRFIRNGNDYYKNEKYVESEVEFRKSLEKEPESFEGRFNLGDALFKQKKVDDAIEQFQALTNSTNDKKKLSDVYHNIGNGFFAKKEFEKSIDAYKQALRNDPTDDETRYNLIAAQKMLQNQKNNQDKKDQDKKDQDKKQQDKQKQKQDQKQDQDQKQQQNQQDKQQQQQQQQQGISKENAERILQSLNEDEKKLQKKLRKAKQQQQRQIEKNW
jgi:tetratricopeptide (TPR) repeat protein